MSLHPGMEFFLGFSDSWKYCLRWPGCEAYGDPKLRISFQVCFDPQEGRNWQSPACILSPLPNGDCAMSIVGTTANDRPAATTAPPLLEYHLTASQTNFIPERCEHYFFLLSNRHSDSKDSHWLDVAWTTRQ